MEDVPLLHSGPQPSRLALAHGAGASMDSDFMNRICLLLAERGVGVVRFEFPYMRQRRCGGSKRPPDKQALLLDGWRQVVMQLGDCGRLWIGGKSMGGRMASMVADELGVAGLICLGYPFHPPRKPEKPRVAHLAKLQTATRIYQGSRDALGNLEDVQGYSLSPSIEVHWLPDGDHDFKPRQRSGYNWQQHLCVVADSIAALLNDS